MRPSRAALAVGLAPPVDVLQAAGWTGAPVGVNLEDMANTGHDRAVGSGGAWAWRNLCCLGAFWLGAVAAVWSAERTPVGQVFQWATTGVSAAWPDGSAHRATLYLWIPEQTERLRGLVIMGTNVPEHMLVGHPAIRRACAEADLGLVWAVPTFWRFGQIAKEPGADARQVLFLEQLLAQLADVSGYAEVATVPWLPVGESGHLLMVAGLIEQRPERILAGVCVKNPHPIRTTTVPVLYTLGTGQEWGQMKRDLDELFFDVGGYSRWGAEREASAWPLSVVIEPGTGHFTVTDAMADTSGAYLVAATEARLPASSSAGEAAPLRAVDLASGFVAHLPLPGQTDLDIVPYATATPAERARPWFFTAALAKGTQALATAPWQAEPQFVVFSGGNPGVTVEPFALNSVTRRRVQTDGISELRAELAAAVPEGFVGAGRPLARAPGAPVVEWLCGPYAPTGDGRFEVSLDRTWKTGAAAYVIARHEGDATTRRTTQPAHLTLLENRAGAPQAITFPPLGEVAAGTATVPLRATASSGLPVRYYVVSGPAVVEADAQGQWQLRLTPVPPRARWPIAITVAAWQWGRATAPENQTAAVQQQTLSLVRAPAADVR